MWDATPFFSPHLRGEGALAYLALGRRVFGDLCGSRFTSVSLYLGTSSCRVRVSSARYKGIMMRDMLATVLTTAMLTPTVVR